MWDLSVGLNSAYCQPVGSVSNSTPCFLGVLLNLPLDGTCWNEVQ